MGSRTQPHRYAGQYHTVQAAPPYLNPNSQAVRKKKEPSSYVDLVPSFACLDGSGITILFFFLMKGPFMSY